MGKSSYKRKPFLAFKLLKRKAFRQQGRAAIADFLRIIAVILLEREKTPFCLSFTLPKTPNQKLLRTL